MQASLKSFWFGYKPGTATDLINKQAAATGSVRYAMAAAHANYNGHCIRVYFNDYRGYWLVEYHWGERVVLYRGGFEGALQCAKKEHERNGAFGSVVISSVPSEHEQACLDAGATEYTAEVSKAEWEKVAPWQAKYVNEAFWAEKHFHVPAVSLLANAKDEEEYKLKRDEAYAKRRNNAPGI